MATNRLMFTSSDETQPPFRERHYAVAEVAKMWSLSSDVVRKLFEHESGVLVIGDDGTRTKRRHRTLRIPESVMQRVHQRLCNPDLTAARSRAYSSGSRDRQLLATTGGP